MIHWNVFNSSVCRRLPLSKTSGLQTGGCCAPGKVHSTIIVFHSAGEPSKVTAAHLETVLLPGAPACNAHGFLVRHNWPWSGFGACDSNIGRFPRGMECSVHAMVGVSDVSDPAHGLWFGDHCPKRSRAVDKKVNISSAFLQLNNIWEEKRSMVI